MEKGWFLKKHTHRNWDFSKNYDTATELVARVCSNCLPSSLSVSHSLTPDSFKTMLLNHFSVSLFTLFSSPNRQVCCYKDSLLLPCLSGFRGENWPCSFIMSTGLKITLTLSPVPRTISIQRQRKICPCYKFPLTNYQCIDFGILSNLHLLGWLTNLLCLSEDRSWSRIVLCFIYIFLYFAD